MNSQLIRHRICRGRVQDQAALIFIGSKACANFITLELAASFLNHLWFIQLPRYAIHIDFQSRSYCNFVVAFFDDMIDFSLTEESMRQLAIVVP